MTIDDLLIEPGGLLEALAPYQNISIKVENR